MRSKLADTNLTVAYRAAKLAVTQAGYADEIMWQSHVCMKSITETRLLRECAWVILSAGMKEAVIRKKFAPISESFLWWESSQKITEMGETCCQRALRHFNHPGKIGAIAEAARRIHLLGFDLIRTEIENNPIGTLQQFSFIGPITSYHLAKNLGVSVAKPDRHLQRLAAVAGYDDVQEFCLTISDSVGDAVPVVDIVLWRYATMFRDYLAKFLSWSSKSRPSNAGKAIPSGGLLDPGAHPMRPC